MYNDNIALLFINLYLKKIRSLTVHNICQIRDRFNIFSFNFLFRGFTLSLTPQHGQKTPSHSTNISQLLHRFCPIVYLPVPEGLGALYL